LPLALLVGWSGLSTLWADDLRSAVVRTACFVLPFGLLAVALARVPWRPDWVVLLWAQLALMGVVFALVGIAQWLTRDVAWAPARLSPGADVGVYRVDAVFLDAAPYARFLVVAILGSVAVALARPAPRVAAAVVAAIVVMWIGLYLAYSASALAALLVGAAVAGALLWRRRGTLVAVGALVLTALVVAGLPQSRHWVSSHAGSRWHDTTRNRTAPFATGARIARDHPFAGVGVGGFERAYRGRAARAGSPPAEWRSTPVVVAAETGAVGLLLLAWLLAEALLAAFRRAGTTFTGRAAGAFGIMTAAIAVHSLFADMLLEDAMFWGLLALAAVARRVREPARD
jgi:O-antigen ligase